MVSYAEKKDGSTLDHKNKKVYLVRGQHKSYVRANPKAGSYDGADYYVYPDGHIVKRSE
ncbi:hypothetical protein [Lactobacillus terrae]|uniref:hypothetical protein n=1 Tax=Lactobacillus terrae TaxID=2269374 RepID=UPI001473B291|nr:hypothetical protein [Lactobacillus terrae]